MKRWVSGAMAFIITFSCAQGSLALASGDADEAVVSALIEQSPEDVSDGDAAEEEIVIVATLPEEDAADGAQSVPAEYELTLGEDVAAEESALTVETVPVEADGAQAADAPRYARTVRADVAVLDAVDGAAIAALGADCTVLVLGDAAADWLGVAFCTERGVVTGCVAAEGLRALDADETAAYLDALAASGAVTLYDGDLNRPLGPVACAFADAGAETETPAGQDGDAEDTPEAPAGQDEDAEETPEAPAGQDGDAQEAAETGDAPAGEATAPEIIDDEDNSPDDTPDTADGEETAGDATDGATDGDADAAEGAEDAAKDDAADAAKDEATEAVKDDATDAVASKDAAAAMEAGASERPSGETAQSDAGAEAVGAEETAAAQANAAEAAFHLNMAQCALGLKETYRGLSATGGSGSVTWTSSNKKIVRVNAATGVIKGLKKGKATVTATCGGATASVVVTVKNAPKKAVFKPKKLRLGAGTTPVQLKLKLGKGGASAGTAYVSSNDAVASVDANGMLTAKSAGTAVITATTYNKKKATCKVTVYPTPAPVSIALPATLAIGVKESRGALPLTMVSEAGDQNCTATVTWKSTNKKVVKVDPNTGAIQAVRKGTATIVAKTTNGLKARCRVKVKKAPKKVSLSPGDKSVEAGGTMQYAVKLPKGSAGAYNYASSNTGVATVDANGLAKAVAAGTTTITVTTYNGKTAKATLTVTAKAPDVKPDVKVPESMKKLGIASYQSEYSANLSNEQKLEHVIYNAQNQLGKPYTYGGGYSGGSNPDGFDCSGLVYWSFGKIKVKLEDSAHKQGYDKSYTKVVRIEELKRGDVVCFNTDQDESDKDDLSDHTGIYLGKGYFIHASSAGKKVMVSQFETKNSDYYKRNFSWGRRILQ